MFRQPGYIIMVIIVCLFMIVLLTYLSMHQFLIAVVTEDAFTFVESSRILFYSLGAFVTNFTTGSRIMAMVVSLLTGINIAMMAYYLRRRIVRQRAQGVGILGTIVAMLGVGCVSCGSVLFSTFIGISSTTVLLGFLPLRGLEFGLIGVAVILFSIYLLSTKIINPDVCKIN